MSHESEYDPWANLPPVYMPEFDTRTHQIEPALTAEEWEMWLSSGLGTAIRVIALDTARSALTAHKHAALILYGHTFGFTQEDVVKLRTWRNGGIGVDHVEWSESLLARIAALLPPETPDA